MEEFQRSLHIKALSVHYVDIPQPQKISSKAQFRKNLKLVFPESYQKESKHHYTGSKESIRKI